MSAGAIDRTRSSNSFFLPFSSSHSSSTEVSKWSSMARLLRPVTNTMCRMPAS